MWEPNVFYPSEAFLTLQSTVAFALATWKSRGQHFIESEQAMVLRNIKIYNSYSEKIKSSYIVITHCYHYIYHNMDRFHSKDLNGTLLIYIAIEHTHCYHHTSQSQFGSFSLQGSLWHFVLNIICIYMAFFYHYKIWLLITKLSLSYVSIR